MIQIKAKENTDTAEGLKKIEGLFRIAITGAKNAHPIGMKLLKDWFVKYEFADGFYQVIFNPKKKMVEAMSKFGT